MAEAVVDGLEIVNVGQDQRVALALQLRRPLAALELLLASAAVEQAGQCVVVGLLAQLLCACHQFGHVFGHADVVLCGPGLVFERRDGLGRVVNAAVFAPVGKGGLAAFAALQRFAQLGVESGCVLARLQKFGRAPLHFVAAVARQVFKRLVDEQNLRLLIGDQHGILRGVQCACQQGLALLGTHPLGDVLLHRDVGLHLALGIAHGGNVPLHQVAAAIFAVVHRRALKKRPAAQAFAQALQHLGVGVRALQQARRAPQQLLLGVPRHAAKRRVAVGDARPFASQRGIGDDHGIESLRHGRVQQLRQVGASGGGRGWQRGHKGGCFTRRGDRVGLPAYQAWADHVAATIPRYSHLSFLF